MHNDFSSSVIDDVVTMHDDPGAVNPECTVFGKFEFSKSEMAGSADNKVFLAESETGKYGNADEGKVIGDCAAAKQESVGKYVDQREDVTEASKRGYEVTQKPTVLNERELVTQTGKCADLKTSGSIVYELSEVKRYWCSQHILSTGDARSTIMYFFSMNTVKGDNFKKKRIRLVLLLQIVNPGRWKYDPG